MYIYIHIYLYIYIKTIQNTGNNLVSSTASSFSSSYLSFCLFFFLQWIVTWNWKLKWILLFQNCVWSLCFIPVVETKTWTLNQICNNLLFCFTYCIENTIVQLLRLLFSVPSFFYSAHIPLAFSLTFKLIPWFSVLSKH